MIYVTNGDVCPKCGEPGRAESRCADSPMVCDVCGTRWNYKPVKAKYMRYQPDVLPKFRDQRIGVARTGYFELTIIEQE